MKRTIYAKLIEWKNKKNKKPLVIKGARQIGKTWIVKEFGKNEYEEFVYVNCDSNERVRELFEHDFNINRIIRGLSALSGKSIQKRQTLIFFDEVQEIPRIVQSLKYFYENEPEYNVIVAGSLLGIHEHSNISFPVGKIETLNMYPLSFQEFILNVAGKEMYKLLSFADMAELEGLHSTFVEYLRQYYFTGGMPEVIQAFIDGKMPKEIRKLQKQILSDYADDISKHAPSEDLIRIDQVLNSIPSQLVKENRKFVYANIQKGSRAKEFEKAIQWLCNCGIVIKINRITKGTVPLKFYEDFSAFKLFFFDCGLFGAMMDAPISQILIGNNIFEEYKGAFTENYVLQQLVANKELPIYYFSAEDSKQELDFMYQDDIRIVPIEVKAEENLRAKSLMQFCKEHKEVKGVRISMSPFRKQDWMINIPLYAAFRL